MKEVNKPILYNGFKLRDGVSVGKRLEKVLFTEIYSLSNKQYLYLFTNLDQKDILYTGKKYDLLKIKMQNKLYWGVVYPEYSLEKISRIVEEITSLWGFACVAGMDQLKHMLKQSVIEPLMNPEKYKKFKLGIPNGILLYGPPGCGKTFIVRKLAEELSYNFVELHPSSIATQYIHGAVTNIAKVFNKAKLEAPSIVFIDEFEGLVPKREDLSSNADIRKEEINEFLLQLNNASQHKILVVGATNRPHLIDSAIMRSGRMDKRIYVSPPDHNARRDLFKMYLIGRPHEDTIDYDALANMTDMFVCSDIELIVTDSARMAVEGNKERITFQNIQEVIAKFPASISSSELTYYKQFEDMERW